MKKLAAVVICLFVLIGLGYVGARLITKNKAKEMIDAFMQEAEAESWKYQSAYLDPFFQALRIKNLHVRGYETNIFAQSVKVYGYERSENGMTVSVAMKDAVAKGLDGSVHVGHFEGKDLVFDEEYIAGMLDGIGEAAAALKDFHSMALDSVIITDSYDDMMVTIKKAGLRRPSPEGAGVPERTLYIEDLVFLPDPDREGARKEYRISGVEQKTVYHKDTNLYEGVLNIDAENLCGMEFAYQFKIPSQELFRLGGLWDALSGTCGDVSAGAELVSMDFAYTDRSLINHLIELIKNDFGISKEEVLELVDRARPAMDADIENGDALMDLLIGFLRNPDTFQLKLRPEEPIDFARVKKWKFRNALRPAVIFNGGEEFFIRFIEDDYGHNDDWDNDNWDDENGDEDGGEDVITIQ